MLASKLCVIDDKTSSKKKWVKETCSMIVLSGLFSSFSEGFDMCCNFM